MRLTTLGVILLLSCATAAQGEPPPQPLRELIGFTTGKGKGLGFKKMNDRCEAKFGAGAKAMEQRSRPTPIPKIPTHERQNHAECFSIAGTM